MSHRRAEAGAAAPYSGYAAIYDQIMAGVDYEGWIDYVESLLQHFACRPRSVIDLACGTGSSTLPLASRGYRTGGIDLSPEMLEQARAKATAAGLAIDFRRGDLRSLRTTERYDLALLFQDGLNYLLSEEELSRAFSGIHDLLSPGGYFIFDLTRPSRRNCREESSFYWADEAGYTLLWESRYREADAIWELFLTMFIEERGGLYRKFQEQHREKDYPPALVERLLGESGFALLQICPTFRTDQARGGEPKLTFAARREEAARGSPVR